MIYLKLILFLTTIYLTGCATETTLLDCKFRPTYFFLMQKCFVEHVTQLNPDATFTFGEATDAPQRFVMEFEDCNLYNIPKDLFKNYNAFKIIMQKSGLVEIGDKRFLNATVLKSVDISRNNISEIKSDVFLGADMLEFLDISFNEIEKIDENALRGAKQLGAIDLANNRIKTIKAGTFQHTPALFQIKLRNNFLTKIEPNTFGRLKKLMTVDIAFNELTEFDDYSGSMSFLYIAYNKIEHLVIGEEIWKLVANNNNITSVTVGKRNEIYNLVLSNNSLTDISNLTSLTKLTDLYLSHNNLATIQPLETLTNLNIIYLEDVGLKQSDLNFFEKLSDINWLDISYNLLKTFDIKKLKSQKELTILHIDGNNLTEIDYKEIRNVLPNLHVISISNNYFNCTFLEKILEQLKTNDINLFIESHTRVVGDEMHREGIGCFNRTLTEEEIITLSKPIDHSGEEVADDISSEEAKNHDVGSKEELNDNNLETLHKRVVLLEGGSSDVSEKVSEISSRISVLEGKGSIGVIFGVLIMLAMFFVTYKVVLFYMAKRRHTSLNDRLIEQQM